jgi:hypothetical protein
MLPGVICECIIRSTHIRRSRINHRERRVSDD